MNAQSVVMHEVAIQNRSRGVLADAQCLTNEPTDLEVLEYKRDRAIILRRH